MVLSESSARRPHNQPSEVMSSTALLMPLAVGMVGLCLGMQAVIAARGSEIDLLALALVGTVVLFYFGFLVWRRDELPKVRFGSLAAHAVAYVVVTGSFQLHAWSLAMANSDVLWGDGDLPIDGGWLGITFGMAGFWAIGFAAHAVASISQRGFEK